MSADVFLRRVKHPDPVRLELARQAVDALEAGRSVHVFRALRAAAERFGVPVDYLLDERERRVRERSGL